MMQKKKDCMIIAGVPEMKPKKNFLVENIRRLREMQKAVQEKAVEKPNGITNNTKKSNLRGTLYQKRRKMCASLDALGSSSIRTHLSTPITAVASLKALKNQANLPPSKAFGELEIANGKVILWRNPVVPSTSTDINSQTTNRPLSCFTSGEKRGTFAQMANKDSIQANHFKFEKKKDKPMEIRKSAPNPHTQKGMPPEVCISHDRANSEIELNAGDGAKLALLANIIRDQNKDFVRKNTLARYEEKVKPTKPDPTRAPPNYRKGVIPKYLQEVKKEILKAEGKEPPAERDPLCPPGHIRLSDEERKEHLLKIKQTYAELVTQLNMLPVRSDSLRVRQRRLEMERELDKLEAGIKIFSKDKLYVKLAS